MQQSQMIGPELMEFEDRHGLQIPGCSLEKGYPNAELASKASEHFVTKETQLRRFGGSKSLLGFNTYPPKEISIGSNGSLFIPRVTEADVVLFVCNGSAVPNFRRGTSRSILEQASD